MAYLENKVQPSNKVAAVVGVIAIHAGLGYVVITGLSNVIQLIAPQPPLVGETIIDLPPPPPPKEAKPEKTDTSPSSNELVIAPRPDIEIAPMPPKFGTTDLLDKIETDIFVNLPPRDPVGDGVGGTSIPKFDPVAARPRNNPANWVTQSDYRSIWINREYTGLAKFKLTVSASGKVENCEITGSTGYAALDKATCKLVQKRARFNAASDANGKNVSGTYTNAVQWILPD